jgi:hypothetical protein
VALTGSFLAQNDQNVDAWLAKQKPNSFNWCVGKAPDGRQRWRLELLADRMVKLEYVEHFSPETVRQALKKTSSSRGSKNPGVFPKKPMGILFGAWKMCWTCIASLMIRWCPEFAWMRIAANLVKNNYAPEPAKPGQIAREDYTYEKKGSANLFIAYEPLAGRRYLKVTEHRTKKDWALFMQEVGARRALS